MPFVGVVRKTLSLCLLLLATFVVGCGSRSAAPGAAASWKYNAIGFRNAQREFAVSGGNLMAHAGQPIVVFGTLKEPKQPCQLTYVILVKMPAPSGPAQNLGSAGHGESSDGVMTTKAVYTIDGKQIEASSSHKPTADWSKVEKEILTIGGKEVDPAAGRLFLLDHTAAAPVYVQKKIDLSGDVPAFAKPEEVESYAKGLLEKLRKHPEVNEHLK